MRSKRLMSVSATLVSAMALALLTTISMPPKWSAVRAIASATAASSRTSTSSGSARPPAFTMSSAAVWMVPGSLGCGVAVLAAMAMLAPSRAARSAMASPMPRDAPVMNRVLPASGMNDLRGAAWRRPDSASRSTLAGEKLLERRTGFRRAKPRPEDLGLLDGPLHDLGRRAVDQSPRYGDGFGRQRRDLPRRLHDLVLDLARRNDDVDETDRLRLLGVHRPAHDEQREGTARAHQARREQARTCFRHHPELGEGRGESRIGRRDHIVEMQEHGHADADRNPLDASDHRLFGMHQPAQETPHRRPQALHVLGRVQEIVEIAAGGEYVPSARDHHAMDGFAVGRPFERGREFVVHVVGDRVLLFEAVHPHQPDGAFIDDD